LRKWRLGNHVGLTMFDLDRQVGSWPQMAAEFLANRWMRARMREAMRTGMLKSTLMAYVCRQRRAE